MGATRKDYEQRLLGGGQLFINEFDETGAKKGKEWFGLTEKLTQTIENEYITIPNVEGSTELVDKEILKKSTVTLAWDTRNISPINLARAFYGNVTESPVTAGTAVDEAITIVEMEAGYPLANKFATSIVVQDATNTTTYVLGTDYRIDATVEPNLIVALTGGAITTNEVLHVDYSYSAYTAGLIEALEHSILEAELIFTMSNSVGYNYTLTYPKCSISSAGDFSLKAIEDSGVLSFTAKAVKVENETGLFKVEWDMPI